jgi:hypothetical protein
VPALRSTCGQHVHGAAERRAERRDQIQMQVHSTSGATLATVLNVCSNSGAWTQVSFNMSAFAGQTVVLWFNDHDDGYPSDPTYFLLDDVVLSGS